MELALTVFIYVLAFCAIGCMAMAVKLIFFDG
jgi:hypothetical protein